MNILVLGAFGKGALEHFYLRGFRQFDVTIDTFDITDAYYSRVNSSLLNKVINKVNPAVFYQPINKELFRYIAKKQYDVIVVFKGMALFPSSIEQLKKHTKFLCCYNPDHPFSFFSEGSGNANIRDSISHYHLYISYAQTISKEVKERYGVDTATIPFGYDDAATAPIEMKMDELADKIIFVGSFDAHRAAVLSKIDLPSLVIFGDGKWKTRTTRYPGLRNAFAGRALYDEEYKVATHTAAGSINLLREQNLVEQSHNMRTFEVPGYGGLLIANRTKEQGEFFEEDKEAVYFESFEELKDKIRFLSGNSSAVKAIKEAAVKRAIASNYSYTHRSREMYDIFARHL
jgi:spore maturation protein CgeB